MRRAPATARPDEIILVALELALDVTRTTWKPRGPADPGIDIEAFAEAGRQPSTPSPLVRVRSGTIVRVTLTNRLDKRVVVRGLYDRADPVDSLVLAAGATLVHAYRARTPGTYLYVGRTTTDASEFGRGEDEMLSGVLPLTTAGGSTHAHGGERP